MTEEPLVLLTVDGPVATLTLNEGHRRNPLSPGLVSALTTHLEGLATDPAVRVVILTGAGAGFCAGADLRRMRAASPLEDRDEYDAILVLTRLLWNYGKPTIAAVHGFALGAGANLMSWCDIALAEPGTRFGFPEVNAGVPSATVIPSLLRIVGRKRMYELVLTGDLITADEAAAMGLVTRVTAPGAHLTEARAMAERIAQHHPDAIRLTKEIVHAVSDMSFEQGITHAKEVRVIARLRKDFRVEVAAGGSPADNGGRP
jgi:enoyl-CoA hydratase/carnithine racemase